MARKIYTPHFSTTTDARVVQTREALRRALLELLKETTLDQITIRAIAAKANVGYTTFFRHHTSKEALLNDIAADEIKRLIDLALPVFDSSNTVMAAQTLCRYVADNKVLWSTLLTGGAAGTLREEFIRLAKEAAAGREEATEWLPAGAGVVLVASGTIELLAWWLSEENPIPVDQLASIYAKVVVLPVTDAYEKSRAE